MGIANRKNRLCPRKGDEKISSKQCAQMRNPTDCPSSCTYWQKYESELRMREYLKRIASLEDSVARLGENVDKYHGAINWFMFRMGEFLLNDPFAEDKDLVQALELLAGHYETGEEPEEFLNRAGKLLHELRIDGQYLRQAPYAHTVMELKHVVRFLLWQIYSEKLENDTSNAYSKPLRETAHRVRNEMRRERTRTLRGETVPPANEDAPPSSSGEASNKIASSSIFLTGKDSDTEEKKDLKLILPGE